MKIILATTQMMFHPFPFLTLPNPDEAAFLSPSDQRRKSSKGRRSPDPHFPNERTYLEQNKG